VRADEIKNWNNLGSSIIRIGQELVLYTSKPKEIGPQEEVENLVVSSSWTDTEHQEVSANTTDAPEYNASASLQEVENTALDINDPTLLSWDSYVILDRNVPLYEWNNDFYYWSHPGLVSQPNRGYYENEELSPQTCL
jgi:hypothetical protein